ncbi:MAG: endonuclease/exonuclease/phosphatase family protein [Candidatus Binatia bacterium]
MKSSCGKLLWCVVAGSMAASVAAGAGAGDVPVRGRRLSVRANDMAAGQRIARVVLRDPAIAAPLPDPRLGSALIIAGGAGPGECHAEIALDPAKWHAIGGAGAQRGYRYLNAAPGTQGVRRVVIRPGAISVSARGPGWPCALGADQRTPLSLVLKAAEVRYCAAFGGTVALNGPGRFLAHNAPAPASCPKTDLTVADLNILHGITCPRPTKSCRLAERIDLLFQWIARNGCPDVVTLQEVSTQAKPLITAQLSSACPFDYEYVYMRTSLGIDDEMILSRYPVAAMELRRLFRNFRTVLFVRLDHPIGAVDVFSTHLASSSDGAQQPCGSECPAACVAAGARTVRECQAVQMAQFIVARHDESAPAVATGDFNASPGSFEYNQFVDRGWTDVYRAGQNPECNPANGVGCTSGRQDEDLAELESPVSNESERIDYIFLIPPGAESLCKARIDPAADTDGDGRTTGIFADDPNPFAASCGPAPAPICWPSDHEGVQLDLNCD